ncbi:Tn3 family transposase [Streptosporangium sp. NPDC005286]|uniref:Tn3 family transposase n=1 Tax=Streptosporangium sp. NPDC005286 TaxID=3154463 RepID=UPI0033B7E921
MAFQVLSGQRPGAVSFCRIPAAPEQEKMIKFNSLLANCVIFHTALDMTDVLRQLPAEGWQPEKGKDITAADIAQLSPYLTAHIGRFGLYATDVLRLRPDDFDSDLPQIDFGGGAVRGVTGQGHAAFGSGVGAHLEDLLGVEERARLHALDEALGLPSGVAEPVGPELLLALDGLPVDRRGFLGVLPHHEVHLRLGRVVAATHDLATARDHVGVADVAVGRDARDEPVGHVDADPPVRVEAFREDRPPDVRPLSVRADQEVEFAGRPVGEVRDDLAHVLLEAVHAQAEDVFQNLYAAFNGAPSRAELEWYFFLDDSDLEKVQAKGRAHNLLNTRYMGAAVNQLRADGFDVRDEDVARLSPFIRSSSPGCRAACARCAARTPPTTSDAAMPYGIIGSSWS